MAGEYVLVIDDSPTILKVVQLVLTRAGYRCELAEDGDIGITLAKSDRPDLILLDFVMPKMNGYQVCRALAADETLKDVPVVLMSAKGDQVGERFVKVMGIVDYITKPFSPEAITAVVGHTIEKFGRIGGAALPLADGTQPTSRAQKEAADAGKESGPESRTTADDGGKAVFGQAETITTLVESTPSESSQDGFAQFRDSLIALVTNQLATQLGDKLGEPTEGAPSDEIRKTVSDAVSDSWLRGALALLPSSLNSTSLNGDLSVIPLAEVLGLLATQNQTGVLSISRGSSRLELSFRSGKISLATAVGVADEFRLGRFVVEGDFVPRAELEDVAREASGALLGQRLVTKALLSDADLRQVLAKQTSELIYEILRWKNGRFEFNATRTLPEPAAEASLGLEVDGIMMEGYRRVDEWHLIERELENFDVVFLRNEDALSQMGRRRLTSDELSVLELVNGKNSVKDIVRQSKLGSFEVSKMLYRLLSIKLVRRRVAPVAV